MGMYPLVEDAMYRGVEPDKGDIEEMAAKLRESLEPLIDEGTELEADGFDLTAEFYFRVDGKTYCVSVEPDGRHL